MKRLPDSTDREGRDLFHQGVDAAAEFVENVLYGLRYREAVQIPAYRAFWRLAQFVEELYRG